MWAVVLLQVALLQVALTYTTVHSSGESVLTVYWHIALHNLCAVILCIAAVYNLLRVIAASPISAPAGQAVSAQVTQLSSSGLPTAQYSTSLQPRCRLTNQPDVLVCKAILAHGRTHTYTDTHGHTHTHKTHTRHTHTHKTHTHTHRHTRTHTHTDTDTHRHRHRHRHTHKTQTNHFFVWRLVARSGSPKALLP